MKLWVSSCFSTRASSGVTAGEALDGNAHAAVVDRADPAGGAGDVRERFAGVENHADGFGRREVELGFEVAKIFFEDVHDSAREIGRGAAVVFQGEMRGLAFAVAFLFGFISFGFFQGVLHFGVGAQFFGAAAIRRRRNPFCSGRSRPSR